MATQTPEFHEWPTGLVVPITRSSARIPGVGGAVNGGTLVRNIFSSAGDRVPKRTHRIETIAERPTLDYNDGTRLRRFAVIEQPGIRGAAGVSGCSRAGITGFSGHHGLSCGGMPRFLSGRVRFPAPVLAGDRTCGCKRFLRSMPASCSTTWRNFRLRPGS
jgi:hypothetical protein